MVVDRHPVDKGVRRKHGHLMAAPDVLMTNIVKTYLQTSNIHEELLDEMGNL